MIEAPTRNEQDKYLLCGGMLKPVFIQGNSID
jgi:hypothetical protein